MKLEVQLANGQRHSISFDGRKEDWFDVLKFNRDSFIQDAEGNYFIVSSIVAFKIIGDKNA